MSFLDRHFPYKFRIRVAHFDEDWFCVEYAYYRFVPNWNILYKWFGTYLPMWGIFLSKVQDAEYFAEIINSIEDIRAFNEKNKAEANLWREEESERKMKAKLIKLPKKEKPYIPYKIKEFPKTN